MEPKNYIVSKIEGEYAYLKDLDDPSAEALFIAMALLPMGIDEGSLLRYEMLTYTLLEDGGINT